MFLRAIKIIFDWQLNFEPPPVLFVDLQLGIKLIITLPKQIKGFVSQLVVNPSMIF